MTPAPIVGLALLAGAPIAHAQVRLFDMPTPGWLGDMAAMSADGERFVVNAYNPAAFDSFAAVWTGSGYEVLGASGRLAITGASHDLSVLGGTVFGPGGPDHGYLRTPDGVRRFDGPDGFWIDTVSGDGGAFAARSFDGTRMDVEIWRGDVRTVLDGPPVGGRISQVTGLSFDGTIAAGFSIGIGPDSHNRSWLWNADTGYTVLPRLNDAVWYSWPMAMAADGSAVIGVSADDFGSPERGWVWSDGLVREITGAGFTSVHPTALSTDASVIAGSAWSDGAGVGFVWTETTGMVSLAGLLADHGVNLGDIYQVWAGHVSPDGSLIGGTLYSETDGVASSRVFVLTIPAPGVPAWTVGLGVVACRRRRSVNPRPGGSG